MNARLPAPGARERPPGCQGDPNSMTTGLEVEPLVPHLWQRYSVKG